VTTNKSHKARGANFESDTRDYARKAGYESEGLRKAGAKDEGDVVIRGLLGFEHVVVECKAPGQDGKIDLPGWLREARLERGHYADARSLSKTSVGVVLIKARGKSIEDAYLVMRYGDALYGNTI